MADEKDIVGSVNGKASKARRNRSRRGPGRHGMAEGGSGQGEGRLEGRGWQVRGGSESGKGRLEARGGHRERAFGSVKGRSPRGERAAGDQPRGRHLDERRPRGWREERGANGGHEGGYSRPDGQPERRGRREMAPERGGVPGSGAGGESPSGKGQQGRAHRGWGERERRRLGKHWRRRGLWRRRRRGPGPRKGPPEERIVLVGNPNVGKSVIFGLLTGRYVVVSNYPGTTVEVSRGNANFMRDGACEIVDTPGVNSLLPMSEDELVARDILLEPDVRGVVQVIDAKNLRRGLLLTLQLAEMGLPFVVALNMSDEARSRGIRIDDRALSKALGVDVIPTVATQRRGMARLSRIIPRPRVSRAHVRYRPEIEAALSELEPLIPENHASARSIALMLLSGDESMADWVRGHLDPASVEKVEAVRRRVRGFFQESVSYIITKDRLKAADALLGDVQKRRAPKPGAAVRGSIERAATHPVWGLFFMAAVLVAVFAFVGYFGAQILVDLLETRLFGGVVSPAAIKVIDTVLPFPHEHLADVGALGLDPGAAGEDPGSLGEASGPIGASYELLAEDLSAGQRVTRFVHDILVGPYGVITMAITYSVAIVLPIVGTFFIAFGLLEDSGYLPRLAVMVNRVFRVLGLNGKAVLPMVLGLGCDTMATLTARILDTRKERLIVTLLLALGVPCSAQLGVIIGMLASISVTASILWAAVVIGVMFIVGFLAARIIPGEASDFILELPPLRLPRPDNIAVKTLARVEWYLKEAVPLFILGTLVLFAMDALAVLSTVQRAVSPVVQGFLNLPGETTEAFIVGFLRRDYGAAGLYSLSKTGVMDSIQILVSLVVITLFVPCIANFFVIVKERGLKTALGVIAFIFPFAFLVGGVLNFVLRSLGAKL